MNKSVQIKEALESADENIAFLARWADSKLERRLSIVQEQIKIAVVNNQEEALELLGIWERQIIEARVMKYDQHPHLEELTEIEMELAEMEAMDKIIESRHKILEQAKLPIPVTTPIHEEGNEEEETPNIEVTQMKLF